MLTRLLRLLRLLAPLAPRRHPGSFPILRTGRFETGLFRSRRHPDPSPPPRTRPLQRRPTALAQPQSSTPTRQKNPAQAISRQPAPKGGGLARDSSPFTPTRIRPLATPACRATPHPQPPAHHPPHHPSPSNPSFQPLPTAPQNPAKSHSAAPQEFLRRNSYCARGPNLRPSRPPPPIARTHPRRLPSRSHFSPLYPLPFPPHSSALCPLPFLPHPAAPQEFLEKTLTRTNPPHPASQTVSSAAPARPMTSPTVPPLTPATPPNTAIQPRRRAPQAPPKHTPLHLKSFLEETLTARETPISTPPTTRPILALHAQNSRSTLAPRRPQSPLLRSHFSALSPLPFRLHPPPQPDILNPPPIWAVICGGPTRL